MLMALTGIGYLLFFYEYVVNERFAFVTPLFWYEKVLGAMMIFVVLTAAKRVVSAGLLYCVIAFLIYPFIGPYLPSVLHTTPHTISDLLDFFYLSLGGIFGLPLGVSATDIALFIIFGSILMRTGGSQTHQRHRHVSHGPHDGRPREGGHHRKLLFRLHHGQHVGERGYRREHHHTHDEEGGGILPSSPPP